MRVQYCCEARPERSRNAFRTPHQFHLGRVDRFAVHKYLEEQVRSCRAPRRPYQPDSLALFDDLARLYQDAAEVAVPAFEAVAMPNTYVESIGWPMTLVPDRSICNCKYRCSDGSTIVHALVKFSHVEYRMDSPAEP
jgi:hypothetical protein